MDAARAGLRGGAERMRLEDSGGQRARVSHVMKTCRGCRPARAEMEFRRMSREHEDREARAAALNCATCGGAAACRPAHAAMKYAAQQKHRAT
jgi:hypothetical protein